MSTKITLDAGELADFSKELKKESSELITKLGVAMRASALEVQTTAKKPGYVPYDTGSLRRSITHELKIGSTGIAAIIGSNLEYAAIHEFGGQAGRNGSVTIRPKRYIQRAIEDNDAKIRQRIKQAVSLGLLK